MGANSKIEWTHHTFNPWIGCAKVSAGCKNCYAEHLMDHRHGRVVWGVNGTRSKTGADNWRKPLQWDKAAKALGVRHRVFCASLADVFEDRPELAQWRADLFTLIDATPNLDWLLLTKRPENIVQMWDGRGIVHRYRDNVWLGTSVEDQAAVNERIPHLLQAAFLARFTFLSCEPLLGHVALEWISGKWYVGVAEVHGFHPLLNNPFRGTRGIDWVICGGESGHGARPMHPEWARSLRDQCTEAEISYLFKQWGEWAPKIEGNTYPPHVWEVVGVDGTVAPMGYNEQWVRDHNAAFIARLGKKAAGRLLDGVEHNGFPDQRVSDRSGILPTKEEDTAKSATAIQIAGTPMKRNTA